MTIRCGSDPWPNKDASGKGGIPSSFMLHGPGVTHRD